MLVSGLIKITIFFSGSIPRWQHNLMGQPPDGSTNAPYYNSFTRWQHTIIFQSPDGSTILWVDPQMAAQYYISITRWHHNILNYSINKWQNYTICKICYRICNINYGPRSLYRKFEQNIFQYTLQPHYNTVVYSTNSVITRSRLGSHCLYFLCIRPSL